ncbi:MAG TPA: DUF6600 domain-containing protein [Thermoanaerobaculia bacterium]|jgi:hypothetical protein|nr:DUF6600 domain-containing protein [Thermoanaerobaculia bacterium]
MKTTRNALIALLLLGTTAGAASAATSISAGLSVGSYGRGGSVDVGFFYDNLAPYGNWIQRPRHGWVWTPSSVSSNWRPYQNGHWVNSDQGWTWLTDEPYGWATYHYGRWYEDPEIGWAWVPGTEWGPAWVSWQEGNDYVGWAPLPPGANINASNAGYNAGYGNDNGYDNGNGYDNDYDGYDDGYGYDNGDDQYGYDGGYGGGYGYGGSYSYGLAPAAYVFVPTRYFLSTSLFSYFVPRVQIGLFFGRTRNCTRYGYSGGRYYNHGISYGHVQRYYGRVPRYRLSELDGFRGHGYRVDGNRVAFYRPRVERGRGGSPLDRQIARRSVVDANRFRAAHPDRQRSYAQNYGRNSGRDYGRNNRLSYPSRDTRGSQRQGQIRPDRQRTYNAPRVQGDRQRSYDSQRGSRQPSYRQPEYRQPQRQYQAPRVQQRQRTYDAPRVQNDRQRSYDSQRGSRQPSYRQPEYRQPQRQYQAPRVQQRQPERQRSYQAPRVQQRQAAPQREYRRGQDSRSRDNGRGNDNGRHRGHGK